MTYSPIDVASFAGRVSSWLSPRGPDADTVVSCRVRLARNLRGCPFPARLDPERAEELCERLRACLMAARLDGETIWVPMSDASAVLRLLLRERHLISRDLAPLEADSESLRGRGVAFGEGEALSAMVNEEDHLRIQSMSAGFDLQSAWERAQELDRELEVQIEFAHSTSLGYLTGCPTNVGTGLRASVMLHLPALGMVRSELEKVFTAAQRTGLAVRGMYGEGSKAAGDFYQVSNQITLGRSEVHLVEDLAQLVPVIVQFERTVRDALLSGMRPALEDRVSHSYGLLRTARAMPTESALAHLSNVRLGLHLGLFDGTPLSVLNELGVQVQRGHVQALHEEPEAGLLEVSERDRRRAELLRRRLG
ncbi:MAG: ATP--guanido phosphotransferase [Planctomycetota bacterium]|jgi:protein arginine kinase|nr:ATP--guanido phosphotransferase [Planctomycetota bacterium]MDP6761680.1 ATP--guanido phosphotransferase [Planctomycetota bacterium]MDP6990691.1 ATP--guanido phosphotransferase [Planctomycetota bacterium]